MSRQGGPKQARSSKDQNSKRGLARAQMWICFGHLDVGFEFVSDFEFRNSNLDA